MKSFILFPLLFLLFICFARAQNEAVRIYDPKINVVEQLNYAIVEAQEFGKHILLQVGGNWCPWCIRLHKFIQSDHEIDSLIQKDFVFVLINYSKENKNLDIMQKLEFPNRFGFPVLIVLDENGRKLHTQNTAYLEQEKSYNRKLLIDFLKQWNKNALDPEKYINNQ